MAPATTRLRQRDILALLGVLSVVLVAVEAEEERVGRRLRPAAYSRDELESIDLFLALLLRFAAAALAISLALPVAVPLLVAFISDLLA